MELEVWPASPLLVLLALLCTVGWLLVISHEKKSCLTCSALQFVKCLEFVLWFRKWKSSGIKTHKTWVKLGFPRDANQSTAARQWVVQPNGTSLTEAGNWKNFRTVKMVWRQQSIKKEGWPWYEPGPYLTQTHAVLPKGEEVTRPN